MELLYQCRQEKKLLAWNKSRVSPFLVTHCVHIHCTQHNRTGYREQRHEFCWGRLNWWGSLSNQLWKLPKVDQYASMHLSDTMLFKGKAAIGLGRQAMLGLCNKKKRGRWGAICLGGMDSWPRYSSTAASRTLQIFKQRSWTFSDCF